MGKQKEKKITNRQVIKQHNDLINSKYELSEFQQKIILLAIAQINKDDTEFHRYSVTIKELEQKLGNKINHQYLKESCIDLLKKPLYVQNGKSWVAFNWFSSIRYHDAEAKLSFGISQDLKPYLLNLKEKFSTYGLQNIINFQGKYTTRFYQFFIQYTNKRDKERTFVLEELYEILKLPKSLKNYSKFQQKVLIPSLEEINEKSNIQIIKQKDESGNKVDYLPISKLRKKVLEISIKWEFKDKISQQTKEATQQTRYKKYIGKYAKYFGSIQKILKVKEKDNHLIAIYYNEEEKKHYRMDFDNLEHLERAIREAQEDKADKKKTDKTKKDRSKHIKTLFNNIIENKND